MKIKRKEIEELILQIESIIEDILVQESKNYDKIEELNPTLQRSARNLIHYRALRTIDITDLQKKLKYLGLSRIARSEAHVLASLENCKFILNKLINKKKIKHDKQGISIKKSAKVLKTHTKDLLGYRSKGRRVRIMVTLPSEAAHNYQLVYDLIRSGMNTARINCAHDGPEE